MNKEERHYFTVPDPLTRSKMMLRLLALSYGEIDPVSPRTPTHPILSDLSHMLFHEAARAVAALGFHMEYPQEVGPPIPLMLPGCDESNLSLGAIKLSERGIANYIGAIDGFCDVSVVATGTLISYGLPDELLLQPDDQWNIKLNGQVKSAENVSGHYLRVQQFTWMIDQPAPNLVTIPSEETRLLRARLIVEEVLETIRDLGFNVLTRLDDPQSLVVVSKIEFVRTNPAEVKVLASTIKSLIKTTKRLFLLFGLPDEPFLYEVDKANAAKMGPGAHRRESDGKWMKPNDWTPPNIEGVLDEVTYLAAISKHLNQ